MGLGRKAYRASLTIFLGGFAALPLSIFACFTFSLACSFLFLLAIYKVAIAIGHSLLKWWHGDPRNSPEAVAQRERAAAYAQRIARSRSDSGSRSSTTTTRSHSNRSSRSYRSNSNVSLTSLPQPDRDYEGVGGWLIPRETNGVTSNPTLNNDADSQALVLNLSRRPDITPPSFRRRSFGAASSGINSPEPLNTPAQYRSSTVSLLHGRPMPMPASPQSYFNSVTAARSTTSVANSRRGSRVTVTLESEETPSDGETVFV